MEQYFGESTPKLGVGLMRLPKLPSGKMEISFMGFCKGAEGKGAY